MRIPRLGCPCGNWQALQLIDPDTRSYRGAIWQSLCPCGRSWTVEVADDPDHPAE